MIPADETQPTNTKEHKMPKLEIVKANDAPLIEISEAAINRGVNDVCDIEVQMDDGTYARFFISVQIKNNRPVVELATNTNSKSVCKTVTGLKRKQD